jgi:hypothetical protein
VRSKRRTAIYIGALVAIVVGAFGVRFYGLAMENRTMVDRGRMATQAAEIPPPRTDLTAAEKDEIESLMSIAAFQFASIPEDANAEELTYLLSLGPNSVVPLTDSVLGVDPGHKGAWALREQAFELYLKAAGARRDAKDYATAMSLSRSADEVTPNTSAVLRLQRSICDDSPEVCAGR